MSDTKPTGQMTCEELETELETELEGWVRDRLPSGAAASARGHHFLADYHRSLDVLAELKSRRLKASAG